MLPGDGGAIAGRGLEGRGRLGDDALGLARSASRLRRSSRRWRPPARRPRDSASSSRSMISSSASSRSLLRRASEASSLSRPCASFTLLVESSRSASRVRRASTTATSDSMRARSARRSSRAPRRVVSSCAQLLAAGDQLLHASSLRRIPACGVGLADAGVELGDFQEAALIGGAGIHASKPTPRRSEADRRPAAVARVGRGSDGGPCRDRTDDIHGVNVALYQLS